MSLCLPTGKEIFCIVRCFSFLLKGHKKRQRTEEENLTHINCLGCKKDSIQHQLDSTKPTSVCANDDRIAVQIKTHAESG